MENRYVTKEKRGGKFELCDEDKEDFEQEQLIKEWLEREGKSGAIELKHTTRKGTARNTLDTRSVRLDEKVFDESGSGTYADAIAGSDGRDLECGLDGPEPEPSFEEKVSGYLSAIGFNQGEIECLVKMWKSSTEVNKLLSEKSAKSLESWKQFEPFSA